MTVATDPRKTGIAAGMTLLAASAVAASVTGTTNETALATIAIPGGAMGSNGGLMIRSTWTTTNSSNAKTMRVRFGGVSGTSYLSFGATTTASFSDLRFIRNRGSASSQVGSLSAGAAFGTTAQAVITTAVDTTAAVDLVFSGQLGLSSETIVLESYEVWLLP